MSCPRFSLEDYSFQETVAVGSASTIIKAQKRDSTKKYCVKVLNKHFQVKRKQIDHVFNEITIQSELKHSFFLSLRGFTQDKNSIFLLFDFVETGTLFNYLTSNAPLKAAQASFYAAIAVIALYKLHLKKVVFRDLKPENLLLTSKGYLKLCDFGYAKAVIDRTYTICGTPQYMAPEVVLGRGHAKAVDYWSLGVLIYEMMSGFEPFRANDPVKLFEKVLKTKVKYPKEFDLDAKRFCKKLLEKNPSKRMGVQAKGAYLNRNQSDYE